MATWELFEHIGFKGLQAGNDLLSVISTVLWPSTKLKPIHAVCHTCQHSLLAAGAVIGLFARTPVSAALYKRKGGTLDSNYLRVAASSLNRTAGVTTILTCV